MGIGDLLKSAVGKGAANPLPSLLAAMGIKASFEPVPERNAAPTLADFQRLIAAPGGQLALIRGTAPNGGSIVALAVLREAHKV